jgi:hypothetical protein
VPATEAERWWEAIVDGLVCLGGREGGGGSVRCDTVDALYFVVGLAGLVLRRDGDDRGADRDWSNPNPQPHLLMLPW